MTKSSKSIFVRGLDSRITEEILWELFLQAGPMDNVRIPLDKETGKPRTFGFVTYQDSCSVPYACELFNDLKLFGRPIICKPQGLGENSRNDNPRHDYQAQSPSQMNSSSDDELGNQRRLSDVRRTPSLQFIGVNESPYGRTPNMNPIGSHPLLQRTVSSDSALSKAQIGLRMQPLMSQSYHNRMGSRGLLETPIISRRGRYGHEGRQLYETHDRRYRTKPY